jgi:hypothetical protein
METILYGKNLCNVLCNIIIEEFNLIDDNHNTNINVTNLSNFLVVKGNTSITNPINFSSLFQNKLLENFNYECNFNVIDLIEYKYLTVNNLIDIDITLSDVKNDYLITNTKENGFVKVDDKFKNITSNNEIILNEYVEENNLNSYNTVIIDDEKVYQSDKKYGLSLYGEKAYETYLRYIFFHISQKRLSNEMNFKLLYNGDINKLSWETIQFKISDEKCKVRTEWLESLILDVFPFDISHVIHTLNLREYNFINDITKSNECWKKKDRIEDFVIY